MAIPVPPVRVPAELRLSQSTQLAVADRDAPLHLRTAAAPAPVAEPQVPRFWFTLRDRVYAEMPQYERRELTLTVAPVVVTGTFDTVPGVGVEGGW